MKINLKTFEWVSLIVFILGMVCALSELHELRMVGYGLSLLGGYLFYQIGEERKRRKRRTRFRHRMEKLMGA